MMLGTLSPTLRQQPMLGPSQRLALEMLRMPLAELQLFLRQQLEENPLLEPSNESTGEHRDAGADEWTWDERPAHPPSLHEHLRLQIRCLRIEDEVRLAAERLIEWLEPDGYLRSDLTTIAETEAFDRAMLEQALSQIQRLDPAGVGARTLTECLLIQLEHHHVGTTLAARIVRDHLDLLAGHQLERLARRLAASPAELQRAIALIEHLDPKPARNFGAGEAALVVPDVLVQWRDGAYDVEVNEDLLPRLRIYEPYRRLLRAAFTSEESKQFIRERLCQAQWLLRAVRQRQVTLRSIARCLVELQAQAWQHGMTALRPLTQQEVARRVGCHASTVSRAIAGKSIQTPGGIMPLSGLFGRTRSRV